MVAAKEGAEKKLRTPKKSATVNSAMLDHEQVVSNTRHIDENTKEIKSNGNLLHVLYGVIILLMLVIAGLAFYVGTMMGESGNNTGGNTAVTDASDIEVTIIDDSRCSDCQTDAISAQIKSLPFLSGATFIEKKFADDWVAELMQQNNIAAIPAVLFNTNSFNDGWQITPYLTSVGEAGYSLQLDAKFNPFETRSNNGFLLLGDKQEVVNSIKAEGHIDGTANAQITWIEYSDVQCPFCAKLHNDGTADTLKAKYGDNLNIIFQHFPLDFHANAQKGAEGLECIAEQDESVYYTVISEVYKKYPNQDVTIDGLKDIAAENGINRDELSTCMDSGKYAEMVKTQMTQGQNTFGVTGTPGNVIINNTTWEYEILSGAYPATSFEAIIDRMLN